LKRWTTEVQNRTKVVLSDNTRQALELYRTAKDLQTYRERNLCMIFIPEPEQSQIISQPLPAKVIGIEYVEDAVQDAIIIRKLMESVNSHFLPVI